MSRKIKYNRFVTEGDINAIVEEKWPGKICPECKKDGVHASAPETQYDEKRDEDVVLSFNVWCKQCGAVLGKWDNTNREYFLGR